MGKDLPDQCQTASYAPVQAQCRICSRPLYIPPSTEYGNALMHRKPKQHFACETSVITNYWTTGRADEQDTCLVRLAKNAASFRVSKNNPISANVFNHRRTAISRHIQHFTQ